MTARFANFVVPKPHGAERGAFRGRRYDNHLVVLGVLSLEASTARRRLLPRLTLDCLNPLAAATTAAGDLGDDKLILRAVLLLPARHNPQGVVWQRAL
jgi:hypothetical protein